MQFDENMTAPLRALYAAVQEKYADQTGAIDYAELAADVKLRLGAAWEAHVLTAYAAHVGAPAGRLYNQVWQFYLDFRFLFIPLFCVCAFSVPSCTMVCAPSRLICSRKNWWQLFSSVWRPPVLLGMSVCANRCCNGSLVKCSFC